MFGGATDMRIGASMPAVDSAMKALNKWYYSKNFPNAEHGFLRAQDDPKNPANEVVQEGNLAATKEAWPQTVDFLKKNMGMK